MWCCCVAKVTASEAARQPPFSRTPRLHPRLLTSTHSTRTRPSHDRKLLPRQCRYHISQRSNCMVVHDRVAMTFANHRHFACCARCSGIVVHMLSWLAHKVAPRNYTKVRCQIQRVPRQSSTRRCGLKFAAHSDPMDMCNMKLAQLNCLSGALSCLEGLISRPLYSVGQQDLLYIFTCSI